MGERVHGTVTRVTDFGAFVELEKGIEGLVHLSEMSWSKRVKHPSKILNVGDTVDAMVLGVDATARRISLGLKQALGDPWADVEQRFPMGAVVDGTVISLHKFDAFVQVAEGVEGMIHVGDITAERRIDHPQDVLKMNQVVKAQVLEIDGEKRRLRLGMKQLVPTSLDEYITEHKEGDVVTGRMIDASGSRVRVELGEGIHATCRMPAPDSHEEKNEPAASSDVSSLSSMLAAKWKGGAGGGGAKREPARAGQIRSFRIVKLDPAAKKIELELA